MQIALIMLIGLLAKNAILITEFASKDAGPNDIVSRRRIALPGPVPSDFDGLFGHGNRFATDDVRASGVGANGNSITLARAIGGMLIGYGFARFSRYLPCSLHSNTCKRRLNRSNGMTRITRNLNLK